MSDKPCRKTIYEQNCEHFRSLNDIMWRVPILVMSLTGGLGIVVATFDLSDPTRRAILIFAGIINLAFILVLFRLRNVIDLLLKEIHDYQNTKHQRGFFVVRVLSSILLVGMLGSFYFAWNVSDVFRPKANASLECLSGTARITVADRPDAQRVLLDVVCNSGESADGPQKRDTSQNP